jgi:hypothetical protein
MNESVRIIFNKIYDLILKNKVIAIAFLLITILIIFSFLSFSVDDDKVSVNLEEEKKTIQSENEFLEKFKVQFQKKNHLLQKNHKK